MTDREKAIVMAFTGVTMLTGEKLRIFYDYCAELMGQRLQTIEIAMLAENIKARSRPDFERLCRDETSETEPVRHGRWGKAEIIGYDGSHDVYAAPCSVCGAYTKEYRPNFCPNCGAKMDAKEK